MVDDTNGRTMEDKVDELCKGRPEFLSLVRSFFHFFDMLDRCLAVFGGAIDLMQP